MIFDGVKSARDRADLIAFLRTLDEEPVTLPEVAAINPGPGYGGLPPGAGREAVYFTCRACHALEQFIGRNLSRTEWDETLEWMVEEQGMNEIEDATTPNLILDYLSTHFGSG